MANAQLRTVLRHVQTAVATGHTKERTDAELLDAFRARQDKDAFAALVRRHGAMVLGVCTHVLRQAEDAEDAFQATFLILARHAASIRKGEALASWLHGTAYRAAMNAKRAAMRRRAHEGRAKTMPPRDSLADVSWREVQAILDEEVQRLPEKHRAAFVLCCLEGKSRALAARELGVKEGTVSSRLAEAKKQLQGRLAQRGITLSALLGAAALAANGVQAAVPPLLTKATVRAALGSAGGEAAAAGTLSPRVVAIVQGVTKGVIKPMFATKLKTATVLLLAALATAAGLPAHQPPAAKQPDERKASSRQPEPSGLKWSRPADQYGDPLPPGASARLGTVRLRHAATVHAVAFSPDGRALASAGHDNRARLWEVSTGKETRQFIFSGSGGPERPCPVYAVAFSPDGRTLAVGGHEVLGVWDRATGKVLWKRREGARFVVFSPDGRSLAWGGDSNLVTVGNAATGGVNRSFNTLGATVHAAAFSPDGKTLAGACEDKTVRLWDVTTAAEVRRLEGHAEEVRTVAFSPDGKWLASGGMDKAVRLWSATTGKPVRQFGAGKFPVLTLAFAPDSKTLGGAGWDRAAVLWDVATGKEVGRLTGPGHSIECLAFSRDGKTLAGACYEGTVHLWDVASGRNRFAHGGHRSAVNGVAYAPDGNTLATVSWDRTVRLWDAKTGKELRRLRGHEAGIRCVAFAPGGRTLVTAGNDATILLWRAATGEEVLRIKTGGDDGIYQVALSPDGKTRAAAAGRDSVQHWDATTGKPARRLAHHAYAVAFSPDGKVLACGGLDKAVRLWDVATGKAVRTLQGAGWVMGVAFSADGRLLASAGGHEDPTIRLWDAATGKLLRVCTGHRKGIQRLAFSPDGRTVASGGWDQTVRLWEAASGRERAQFARHEWLVTSVAFSPGGHILASGGAESTVLLWDLAGRSAGRPAELAGGTAEFQRLWADLAGGDAAKAYQAVRALAAAPKQAVPFLRQRLKPLAAPTAAERERFARLLADLDSNTFAVREKAAAELDRQGAAVEPLLRQALAGKPSLEVRRRLEKLLDKLDTGSPDRLRLLRALEALEHAGGAEAKRLFESLAKGAPGARLTLEAQASLDRLGRRP